jgi:hypothetical protein
MELSLILYSMYILYFVPVLGMKPLKNVSFLLRLSTTYLQPDMKECEIVKNVCPLYDHRQQASLLTCSY